MIQFFWRSTAILFEMIDMAILINLNLNSLRIPVFVCLGPFCKSIIGSMLFE